jgi:O-antigen/teichoic acid export membrane protein
MDKDNFGRVLIDSIWKFIATVIGKVGALLFVIIIARLLKPEGFGIYNLAMSIVLVFLTFSDVGINQTLLRYFSHSLGKKNKSKSAAYFRYLLKIKIFLLFIFSIVLLILAYPLSFFVFKKPDLLWPLMILSIYLIASSLGSFFEKIFYVINKIKYLTIKEMILQTLKILLVISFMVYLGKNVVHITTVIVIANIVGVIFLFYYLKKIIPYIFEKTKATVPKKRIIKFLKYMTLGGLSIAFFGYVDILMLGIFLKATHIGYYSAAFTLIEGFTFLISISLVLMPMFTQLKKSKLKGVFDVIFKYNNMLSIPLVFGALVLGRLFIKLIYGNDYLPAVAPFMILAFLIFSTTLWSILVSLFSAREKPKEFVKVLLIATILNVILNYTLITTLLKISPAWALSGAAIATLISNYFYLICLVHIANKKLEITFNKMHVLRPLLASLVMFLSLTFLNKALNNMTIFLGIINIILGVIIYFIILYLVNGITKEDYNRIKGVFKTKKSS